jgi:dihydroorotate dehydrogenase (fumarate)/dihydroorotate dehydrogenase
MSLYGRLKPFLLRADPEWVHQVTVALCAAAGRLSIPKLLQPVFAVENPRLATTVGALSFPNPVGLAAGFDKNGRAVTLLSHLGFGSVEVGSVSANPSSGNPQRPRLWRLETDEGLRVFYGCPNDGATTVAARLRKAKLDVPLGINLVETNTGMVSSAEHAAQELARAVRCFADIADYIVLNLNCPNLPQGGRGLFDDPRQLSMLLALCASLEALPPVFLKLTPPGDPEDPGIIEPILAATDPYPFVKGFILNIVNRSPYTTLRTARSELDRMRGGITGPSLREPTKAALSAWYARIDRSRHVLIGVGGISSAADAYQMLRSGASLVQLYTALVYRGPGLVKQINEGILQLLDRDGFKCVGDAVGVDVQRRDKHLRLNAAQGAFQ